MIKTIITFRPLGEEHRTAMHELRHRVYTKFGYIVSDGLTVEIDEFDSSSVHFIAIADDGRILGTIRLIRNSVQGFPVEKYFELAAAPFASVERFNVVEVSRLAVESPSGLPKHAIMLGLIKTIFTYCLERGWIYWYLAADSRVLTMLKKFHFAINSLGDGQEYLGSHTVPAFINIREGFRLLQAENPDLADFLSSGEVTPPAYAWYQFQAAS